MDSSGGEASQILREIEKLELEKSELEHRISVLQDRLGELNEVVAEEEKDSSCHLPALINRPEFGHGLSPDMIYRYSRHLLLSSFGVQGQSSLVRSSILVVGAGGLGAPALLYLAACGPVVVLIIHTEAFIGRSKVESAAAACCAINSTVQIEEHKEALRASNALEIVSKYDIVIDATDNVPSRYMISDCCVILGKPLVSGAALGLEGQGKIRGRCLECEACGDDAGFTQQLFRDFDYEKFTQKLCLLPLKLNLLPEGARISAGEYKEKVINGEAHLLVDVRPAHHFKIVSLPKSLNIPLSSLESKLTEISLALKREEEQTSSGSGASLFVICRRGNDSQRAVQYLHEMGFISARDFIGGIEAWALDVDPNPNFLRTSKKIHLLNIYRQ